VKKERPPPHLWRLGGNGRCIHLALLAGHPRDEGYGRSWAGLSGSGVTLPTTDSLEKIIAR